MARKPQRRKKPQRPPSGPAQRAPADPPAHQGSTWADPLDRIERESWLQIRTAAVAGAQILLSIIVLLIPGLVVEWFLHRFPAIGMMDRIMARGLVLISALVFFLPFCYTMCIGGILTWRKSKRLLRERIEHDV